MKKIVLLATIALTIISCNETPKTKDFVAQTAKFGWKTVLFIDGDSVEDNLLLASGNLVKWDAIPAMGANVFDILNHETLVLTESAVKKLEERLA